MGIIPQIIIGLLMVVVGVLLIKNNYQVSNNMRIAFAEEHLGSGGSYLVWKVLAILLILAGFSVVFGFYDNILAFILSPLTNILSPSE
jgi:uncharacterized membrane protein YphA (DoxX/SURF4 family)